MKKLHLAILGGVGLIALFVVASYLYKGQRADKLQTMSASTESPLSRSYAQSVGPADAKVVIVEFFDPGCETCRVLAGPVKRLVDAHPGRVRLVLRYAPFHHGADTMVQILEAARLQGKYWETLQVMFDSQQFWASHHQPQPERIWEFLPAAGVDVNKVRADMNSAEVLNIVRQDIADAKTLNVHKTPEFFVNGKTLPSFGFPQLQTLVESEVAAKYGR